MYSVPKNQQTLILPDIEEETEFFNAQERVSKNKITGGILSSHSGMFHQQGQQQTKDQGICYAPSNTHWYLTCLILYQKL